MTMLSISLPENGMRKRRASKLDQLFPQGAPGPALQALLKVPLYPYQAEGALFAARVGRALICDDMGLGQDHPGDRRQRRFWRNISVSRAYW